MNIILEGTRSADNASTAKIISKIGSTTFLVRDQRGRKVAVESEGKYKKGQTVRIKNSIILSLTKASRNVKHYQV